MTQIENFTFPTTVSGNDALNLIEQMFAAALSQNSGPTEPDNPRPGMAWRDTSTTPHTTRVRNSDNSEWILRTADLGIEAWLLASTAEAQAGTVANKITSPAGVHAAISAKSTALKAATGWQKMPSGLIMQWGPCTTVNGRATITFPVAFPAACSLVTGSHYGSAGSIFVVDPSLLTKTGFGAIISSDFSTVTATPWAGRWFALGY